MISCIFSRNWLSKEPRSLLSRSKLTWVHNVCVYCSFQDKVKIVAWLWISPLKCHYNSVVCYIILKSFHSRLSSKKHTNVFCTWACVSEFLMLALRFRHALCILRDARVTSDRRWDMSRSVAVFISANWRRKATTARHRDNRRLCSAEKYSLKDYKYKLYRLDIKNPLLLNDCCYLPAKKTETHNVKLRNT